MEVYIDLDKKSSTNSIEGLNSEAYHSAKLQIKRFIKTKNYQRTLKSHPKWKPVINDIIKGILCSDNLYYNKSNRTASDELGVAVGTINNVRNWLNSTKYFTILKVRTKRGKINSCVTTTSNEANLQEKLDSNKYLQHATRYHARKKRIDSFSIEESLTEDLTTWNQKDTRFRIEDEEAKTVLNTKNINCVCDVCVGHCECVAKPKTQLLTAEEVISSYRKEGFELTDEILAGRSDFYNHSFPPALKAAIWANAGFLPRPAGEKKCSMGSFETWQTKGIAGRLKEFEKRQELRGYKSFWDWQVSKKGQEKVSKWKADYEVREIKTTKYAMKSFERLRSEDSNGIDLGLEQACFDLDVKSDKILGIFQKLLPETYIQGTKNGFHAFVQDCNNVLQNFTNAKWLSCVDIKRGKAFIQVDRRENCMSYVQGDLRHLQELPENFLELFVQELECAEFTSLEHEVFKINDTIEKIRLEIENRRYIPQVEKITTLRKERLKLSKPAVKYSCSDALWQEIFNEYEKYCLRWREKFEIISGERHSVVFNFAMYLKGRGYSENAIATAIYAVNDSSLCEYSLDDGETKQVISSVVKMSDLPDFYRVTPLFGYNFKNCQLKNTYNQ